MENKQVKLMVGHTVVSEIEINKARERDRNIRGGNTVCILI